MSAQHDGGFGVDAHGVAPRLAARGKRQLVHHGRGQQPVGRVAVLRADAHLVGIEQHGLLVPFVAVEVHVARNTVVGGRGAGHHGGHIGGVACRGRGVAHVGQRGAAVHERLQAALHEIVVKGVQVFLPQTVHHDTHHQLGAFGYGGENMEEKEKRHYPQPPKGGYYPQPPEGGFDP